MGGSWPEAPSVAPPNVMFTVIFTCRDSASDLSRPVPPMVAFGFYMLASVVRTDEDRLAEALAYAELSLLARVSLGCVTGG